MVAIIKSGYSLRRNFYYNEHKLEQLITAQNGEKYPAAELLMAGNYPMDLSAMSQQHRLNMLLKTAELNPNVKRNSVHISLNFSPGEHLDKEKLNTIAEEYMEAIGFGDQPYLVYRHHDAGHPHIHIVTVKVDASGNGIKMQNIGKTLSEPARKEIEKRHGLVAADDHKRSFFRLKPIPIEKVVYGKTQTKNAIANILSQIVDKYKYTSLNELNAVLNLYNVHANPGGENSRIRRNNGLQFRLLDAAGKPVGAPIKASHIYLGTTVRKPVGKGGKSSLIHNSPTLGYLEGNFKKNKLLRAEHAASLKLAINSLLKKYTVLTAEKFSAELQKLGIRVVERRNAAGRLYGITYVDHRNKCVFNGSSLGKEYSANAISERLTTVQLHTPRTWQPPLQVDLSKISPAETHHDEKFLWDILTEPTQGTDYVPYPLRPKRKKRRKRNRPTENNL